MPDARRLGRALSRIPLTVRALLAVYAAWPLLTYAVAGDRVRGWSASIGLLLLAHAALWLYELRTDITGDPDAPDTDR